MTIPPISTIKDPDLALGGAIFLMQFNPEEWIHRRVESIGLLDLFSFRRRISVDFEIARDELTGYPDVPIVPLALLEKQLLIHFDLLDEQGKALPLLTKEQNAFVAWSALARIALFEIEEATGVPSALSRPLLNDLKAIVLSERTAGERLVESLASRHSGSSEGAILGGSDFFLDLAFDLARHYLLITPVQPEEGERRIFKFAYAQEMEARPGKTWSRFVARMGWGATQLDFQLPAVGQGSSYHVELAPPPGLAVADGALDVSDPAAGDYEVAVDEAGHRIHGYVARASASATGILSVWLWPVRAGLVRTGLVTSIVTTLALGFLLLTDAVVRLSGDTSAAFLLTIPGLIAAFIVRPGEHSAVSGLLLGIRLQIAFAGFIAYAAALTALGGFSDLVLGWIWLVLYLLLSLDTISLAIAYIGIPPVLPDVGPVDQVDSGVTDG